MLSLRSLQFLYNVLKQVNCSDDETAEVYAETFREVGDQLRAATATEEATAALNRPQTRAERRREASEAT
jgi:hypothetical protein